MRRGAVMPGRGRGAGEVAKLSEEAETSKSCGWGTNSCCHCSLERSFPSAVRQKWLRMKETCVFLLLPIPGDSMAVPAFQSGLRPTSGSWHGFVSRAQNPLLERELGARVGSGASHIANWV